MTMPDHDPASRLDRPLPMDRVMENLRQPDDVTDAEWAASQAIYGMIAGMNGEPRNMVLRSPYGNRVASFFAVDPFAGEIETRAPELVNPFPIILGFAPTRESMRGISVQTMVTRGEQIQPLMVAITTRPVFAAQTADQRIAAIGLIRGKIQEIASRTATHGDVRAHLRRH